MGDTDRISQELREVEKELDEAYRSNGLLGISLSTATWTLLGVFEDVMARPIFAGEAPNLQTSSQRENLLINALKHALRWVQECPRKGQLEPIYTQDLYESARDLLQLGQRYDVVETMFVFASRGHCNLALEGKQVVPTPLVDSMDARYYAYNRFLAAGSELPDFSTELESLTETVKNVRVTNRGFKLSINPEMIARQVEAYKPLINGRFRLPGEWRTTRYTFADFKTVFSVLWAIAALQFRGRIVAAARGAPGLGFDNIVLVYGVAGLRSRVAKHSGLDRKVVSAILEDLTYGSRVVSRPDPVIQPIISVGCDTLLIAPSLILCSSPERNLCTLLNSIPEERKLYATMVDEKETVMRGEVLQAAAGKNYRFYFGKVKGRKDLPDIDIALIDDYNKKLLMIEFKWFIAPDEVREVLNRSDDLRKGVTQMKALLSVFHDGSGSIQNTLSVPDGYECHVAVVSQNWIGLGSVQDEIVPIVSLPHLARILSSTESLSTVLTWLDDRKYLPVEGVHFKIVKASVGIGGYDVGWWDIKPLIVAAYDACSL